MARNSSSDQARAFARQQADRPFTPPPRRGGSVPSGKGAKFASDAAGAAGAFVGAAAGGFVPPINVTVNNKTAAPAPAQGQNRGGGKSHFLLGDPDFDNTEDVRAYCNAVRALMAQVSIELAMAGKILEARLAQAQTLPDDNPIQARLRAAKVGRKFKKAADGSIAAARSAMGAYGAFTREYADLMNPRPQRTSAKPFQF
ncbi:plasmid transfer protein TraA [Streptomyces sp. NPDC001880]